MLKIKGIRLKDFGRHREIDQKTDSFIVGLAAPNGKGKSTILQAMQFGFTGTIDHPDPLKEFIRKAAGEKPPKKATVEIDFEADGRNGTITRHITNTTTSRVLRMDGLASDLTGDKAVADVLFQLLGVDKTAINSTVFIKQGEIRRMFGDPTERRNFYIKLMMLGHMKKISDIIDSHRKQQATSIQDLGGVRDAAAAAEREASEFLESCRSELEQMPDVTAALAIAREIVTRYAAFAEAEALYNQANDSLTNITNGTPIAELIEQSEKLLAMHNATREQLFKDIAAMREAVATYDRLYVKLGETVRLTQDFAELANRKAEVESMTASVGIDPTPQLKEVQRKLEVLKELETLPTSTQEASTKLTTAKETLAGLIAKQEAIDPAKQEITTKGQTVGRELEAATALLASLQSAHKCNTGALCMACGSNAPDLTYLDRRIATLTEEKEKLTQEYKDLVADRPQDAVVHKYRGDVTLFEAEHKRLSDRLGLLMTESLDFEPDAVLLKQKSDLEASISTYHAAAGLLARATTELATLSARLAGKVMPAQNELSILEAEVAEAKVAAETAKRNVGDHDEAQRRIDEVRALAEQENAKIKRYRQLSSSALSHKATLERASAALGAQLSHAVKVSNEDESVKVVLFPLMPVFPAVLTDAEAIKISDELTRREAERNEAVGRLASARQSAQRASDALVEVELKISEQGKRAELVKDLERLREAFNPNGVTTEYLDYMFGKISRLAAEYLAESNADFMVAASETQPLAFDFLKLDRPDEVWMPQNRMSGGQQVRLAVATLRAIHALVMPNVGLLVLDEPTTHLDAEAKASMADMLKKIGEEGTLQIIVCDHDPVLIDAFGCQIVIPE